MNVLFLDIMIELHFQRNSHKVPIIDADSPLFLEFNSPAKTSDVKGNNSDSQLSKDLCPDTDVIDNIEEVYFQEDFSPSRYELEVNSSNFQLKNVFRIFN